MVESRPLLKVLHVAAEVGADAELVKALIQAEVIYVEYDLEGEALISQHDAERLRLVQILTRELDVNLAGVEVILHMRDDMLAMQKQFADILDAIAKEFQLRRGR